MITRVGVWISIVMLAAAACGGMAGLGGVIGIDPTVIPQANYPRVIGLSCSDEEFTVTVALQASPYTSLVAIEVGDGRGGRYKGSSYQTIAPHVPWSLGTPSKSPLKYQPPCRSIAWLLPASRDDPFSRSSSLCIQS